MLVRADELARGLETSASLGADDSGLPAGAVLLQHCQQCDALAVAVVFVAAQCLVRFIPGERVTFETGFRPAPPVPPGWAERDGGIPESCPRRLRLLLVDGVPERPAAGSHLARRFPGQPRRMAGRTSA